MTPILTAVNQFKAKSKGNNHQDYPNDSFDDFFMQITMQLSASS